MLGHKGRFRVNTIQHFLGALALLVLLSTTANAQPNQESEMEARAALERFLEAWNTADNSAIQKTVNVLLAIG